MQRVNGVNPRHLLPKMRRKDKNMTYREALERAAALLSSSGVPEPEFDARELLLHETGLDTSGLLLHREETFPEEKLSAYFRKIELRALRVPLQHILGEAWFYGRRFFVTPDVLIPRFDTEVLVSEVLKHEKASGGRTALDLCTGSGIIGITLALEGGFDRVDASDISEKALSIAKKNAEALGAQMSFFCSDLFSEISGKYDVIVSNPPYIPAETISGLEPEVRDYDPENALNGGADGLDFYRRIAGSAKEHFSPGGRLYLEIGDEEGEAVREILAGKGFHGIRIIRDFNDKDRVVTCLTD